MRNKPKIEVLGETAESVEEEVVADVVAETVEEETEAVEETETVEEETEAVEEAETTEGDTEPSEHESEIVVMMGEETVSPPQQTEDDAKAPAWVRELRKTNREQAKRIRELERQTAAKSSQPTDNGLPPLPKEPELDDDDIDYDTGKFKAKLMEWTDLKRQHEKAQADAEARDKAATEAWQQRLENYGKERESLAFDDFDDAEASVLEAFDQTQQGVLVKAAKQPALVVYALGKSKTELQRLAAIKDPIEFAAEVREVENTRMKVEKRKGTPPPPPEKPLKTAATSKGGAVDSQLERLREDAARTGDYTKVTEYRRQQRAKQR